MGICGIAEHPRVDCHWKDTLGERFQAGNEQSSNVRRVNDDKCEQAGERQRANHLEGADHYEWTEVGQDAKKNNASCIEEHRGVTIAVHPTVSHRVYN